MRIASIDIGKDIGKVNFCFYIKKVETPFKYCNSLSVIFLYSERFMVCTFLNF